MVNYFAKIRHVSQVFILALIMIGSSGTVSEITGFNAPDNDSLLGNYLAGRYATVQRDNRRAVEYYRKALKRDPANKVLLGQSFLLELNAGYWKEASVLAKKLVKFEPNHSIARLLLGIEDFRKKRYKSARQHFSKAGQGAVPELTTELALAWTHLAQKNPKKAMSAIKQKDSVNWLQLFRRYHKALIADIAGQPKVAGKAFDYILKRDPQDIRIATAHARHLTQLGQFKKAKDILDAYVKRNRGQIHPIIARTYEDVKAKRKSGFVVRDEKSGLAEVFYGLGYALSSDGGFDYGAIYLQMALYLEPDMELVHIALANIYERTKKYDLAIKTYKHIKKDSPLWSRVQLRKALNYNYMEKVDESVDLLKNLIKKRPNDIQSIETLGNILRSHKRYKEALHYYDMAVKQIDKPERKHWVHYYHRGVCYERLNQWDKAEKDLKKAMELDPNQPLVLNYLGYSWVDQNQNLDEAIALIRKAVKLRPNDGYIVDSLGWAYYRLKNFNSAVEYLEKAVSLKPEDPVINDHLGDAYWYVGRKLEAKYQWSQALSLKPEEKEIPKIKAKLKDGLPDIKVTDEASLKDKEKKSSVKE